MALSCVVCEIYLFVENCEIFILHLYLTLPQGMTPSEFRQNDTRKTRMIGLPCGEETITVY